MPLSLRGWSPRSVPQAPLHGWRVGMIEGGVPRKIARFGMSIASNYTLSQEHV